MTCFHDIRLFYYISISLFLTGAENNTALYDMQHTHILYFAINPLLDSSPIRYTVFITSITTLLARSAFSNLHGLERLLDGLAPR